MKYLNKLATTLCAASFGMMALTSCEGGDMFSLNAPDWLSSRIDEIAGQNKGGDEEIEGLQEDVYTIGATDFSTGWWAQFSKYYQIPDGEKWYAQFNLNINPAATNTYKNFALILCNDEDRGAGSYREYGAIRFDNQPSGNSEWGDYIDRDQVQSTLTFGSDTDEGVDKLGGKVTLSIDRTDPNAFTVTITNGTVTKVYKQKTPLVNLNDDPANTNIRAFLVPEGSFINFLASTIEPIGGFTEAGDKQPVSMVLNGVPKKVLQGSDPEEIFANVTATVTFEQEVTATVTAKDLTFQTVPSMTSLGKKTLVAVYAKTYKGEGADKPVIATAEFEVVDKMYTCVGATDNSTGFWGAHSDAVKIGPNETYVTTFTNYTTGAANWNNFVMVLNNSDGSFEYGVFRADNWGWGTGWDGAELAAHCTPSGGQADWATWLAAMDGAKVTVVVTNNGDGTADIKTLMIGTDGVVYTQDYLGVTGVNPNDFYFHLTVDGCHLEFDEVTGADDNSTGFWGAHSDKIQVPVGRTVTQRFVNHTTGGANWNNFITVLTNVDGSFEYGVFRADNWGWGTGWDGAELASHCTPSGGQADWAAWLAAMDGAKVTVSVTNHGTTADIKCVMLGNDGVTYTQDYMGITGINGDDLFMHFTVDGCHLVFE